MLVAHFRQTFEERVPQPALPDFVRPARTVSTQPAALLPACEPVAPIGEIALEAACNGVRQRQARHRTRFSHALRRQCEIVARRKVVEQGQQVPAHALGLERRTLRQAAEHGAHRLPQPASGKFGPDAGADAVTPGVALL